MLAFLLLWPNGCMDQDATWYGGKPQFARHCVRWGPTSFPLKGYSPNFRPMSVVAKRLDGLRCYRLLGMDVDLGPGDFVFDGEPDPATPEKRDTHPTEFLAHIYCGQTAGWIKKPLGTEVGLNLGPRDVVLDGLGRSSPPKRGTGPQFSVHVYCGQTAGWVKTPLSTELR